MNFFDSSVVLSTDSDENSDKGRVRDWLAAPESNKKYYYSVTGLDSRIMQLRKVRGSTPPWNHMPSPSKPSPAFAQGTPDSNRISAEATFG